MTVGSYYNCLISCLRIKLEADSYFEGTTYRIQFDTHETISGPLNPILCALTMRMIV